MFGKGTERGTAVILDGQSEFDAIANAAPGTAATTEPAAATNPVAELAKLGADV